jgi:PTS system nitrogen regulatory IIA component
MRLAAGLSLREMARRIGVSAAYLSSVEREQVASPTHERLRAMAEVLGVPARRITALSDRLSPDLIAFLEATPGAVRFLRAARDAGLDDDAFAALANDLTRGDARGSVPARAPGLELDPARVFARLRAPTKEDLLDRLTRRALRDVRGVDADAAVAAVLAREAEASTGLGGGVAIAHAEASGLREHVLAVATVTPPVEFESIDGRPVSLVFLVLGKEGGDRLKLLARTAELCVRPGLTAALVAARSSRKLYELLVRADAREP